MDARKISQNWRKDPVNAAVKLALRAAGAVPTQGGGVG